MKRLAFAGDIHPCHTERAVIEPKGVPPKCSWWVGVPRPQWPAVVEAERPRMHASKEGRQGLGAGRPRVAA